jgi:hypothetical protein
MAILVDNLRGADESACQRFWLSEPGPTHLLMESFWSLHVRFRSAFSSRARRYLSSNGEAIGCGEKRTNGKGGGGQNR